MAAPIDVMRSPVVIDELTDLIELRATEELVGPLRAPLSRDAEELPRHLAPNVSWAFHCARSMIEGVKARKTAPCAIIVCCLLCSHIGKSLS